MEMIFDKKGNLSMVRVSMLIVFVGFLFVLGSLASWYIDNETRKAPFDVALPEGAVQWGGIRQINPTSRQIFYQVPNGDMDLVVAHYNQMMYEHYGDPARGTNPEQCIRFPRVGEFEDYKPGQGMVPFQYKCAFDRGGLNATQFTEVIIQPGVFDADPLRNSEGAVVIAYEQFWQS